MDDLTSASSASPDPGAGSPPPGAPDLAAGERPPATTPLPETRGTTATATVGHAQAGVLNVASMINEYFVDAEGGRSAFAFDSGTLVTVEQEKRIDAIYVADDKPTARLLRELAERRILLLVGQEGVGKRMFGRYLCAKLRRDRLLERDTVAFDPLDKRVRIDFPKALSEAKNFGERATLFFDALAGGNRDLTSYLGCLDRTAADRLTDTLRAANAYCILTIDGADATRCGAQWSDAVPCFELSELPRELVERALERLLEWYERQGSASAEHLRAAREERHKIVQELQTIQRVSLFLTRFLHEEADVLAALKRFHDVGDWFSRQLSTDIDAWCFALTLGAALAARNGESVRWNEFEQIRRAVSRRVRADDEIFPRRPAIARDEEMQETRAAQSVSDDALVTKCHAEVVKDANRLADVVRFVDQEHAAGVWEALVTRHRRVLTAIVPVLRRLAEAEEDMGVYAVRVLASQMLGRIGELDPYAISIPLVQKEWVRTTHRRQRPFVGRVLQGILSSDSEVYRSAGITAVDALAADRSAGDESVIDRLLTAISAYSQLGVNKRDTAVAMEGLGAIAIARLAPVTETLNDIGNMAERLDRHVSRTVPGANADQLLYERLGRATRKLSDQHAAVFIALQRAIVYLCFMTDPIPIFQHMQDWMAKGGGPARTLVSLLFLVGEIPDQLQALGSSGGAEDELLAEPIVQSLRETSTAVDVFSGFLAQIHFTINTPFVLPATLQSDLRDRFAAYLMRWAIQGAHNSEYRSVVEELFVSLARARNLAAADDVLAVLSSTELNDIEAGREFAAQCRKRLILG